MPLSRAFVGHQSKAHSTRSMLLYMLIFRLLIFFFVFHKGVELLGSGRAGRSVGRDEGTICQLTKVVNRDTCNSVRGSSVVKWC